MKPNLYELRKQALTGDRKAITEIRDIALQAISTLNSLAAHPAAGEAVCDVAARSICWPVRWDAIQEIREPELGIVKCDAELDGTGKIGRMGIGDKLGIRTRKKPGAKKPRNFGPNSQTGFALQVWEELEAERTNINNARHPADIHPDLSAPGVLTDAQLKRDWRQLAALLDPLSNDTLTTWVITGVELCHDWSGGKWETYPWADAVMGKAAEEQELAAQKRGFKSAIQIKLRTGLKSLLL